MLSCVGCLRERGILGILESLYFRALGAGGRDVCAAGRDQGNQSSGLASGCLLQVGVLSVGHEEP